MKTIAKFFRAPAVRAWCIGVTVVGLMLFAIGWLSACDRGPSPERQKEISEFYDLLNVYIESGNEIPGEAIGYQYDHELTWEEVREVVGRFTTTAMANKKYYIALDLSVFYPDKTVQGGKVVQQAVTSYCGDDKYDEAVKIAAYYLEHGTEEGVWPEALALRNDLIRRLFAGCVDKNEVAKTTAKLRNSSLARTFIDDAVRRFPSPRTDGGQ